MRYEDENVWLTQKMMAELYDVSIPAINQHLKSIFEDNELQEDSVIKNKGNVMLDYYNITVESCWISNLKTRITKKF